MWFDDSYRIMFNFVIVFLNTYVEINWIWWTISNPKIFRFKKDFLPDFRTEFYRVNSIADNWKYLSRSWWILMLLNMLLEKIKGARKNSNFFQVFWRTVPMWKMVVPAIWKYAFWSSRILLSEYVGQKIRQATVSTQSEEVWRKKFSKFSFFFLDLHFFFELIRSYREYKNVKTNPRSRCSLLKICNDTADFPIQEKNSVFSTLFRRVAWKKISSWNVHKEFHMKFIVDSKTVDFSCALLFSWYPWLNTNGNEAQ